VNIWTRYKPFILFNELSARDFSQNLCRLAAFLSRLLLLVDEMFLAHQELRK